MTNFTELGKIEVKMGLFFSNSLCCLSAAAMLLIYYLAMGQYG